MSLASVPGISTDPNQIPPGFLDRRFNLLLLLITFAALVPLLELGSSQFISYDGYWHVFTATQDRWRLFLSEWRADAHPPLYYLALRIVAKLGTSHLLCRSLSIVPGVLGTYLVGRIGSLLFRAPELALLAAGAYGFSISMIEIFCDVRGYSLALTFVIGAFWCLVRMLGDSRRQGARGLFLWWSVLVSLGILTEYYVIFFFCASLIVLSLEILRRRQCIRIASNDLREWWPALTLGLALPFLTIVWLYTVHFRFQPRMQNNVVEFYLPAGRAASAFLWSGLRSDLNYLVPFSPHSAAFQNVAAALLIAVTVCVAAAGAYRKESCAHGSLPALILLILLAELGISSVVRIYPFGGYERQQSIVFPFFVLTLFGSLDLVFQLLSSVRLKRTIAGAALIAVAGSFAYSWRNYPRVSEELFTATYQTFRAKLPDVHGVYLDQFSLIAYFTHTHDWHWKFREHLQCPERVDVYETVSPGGRKSLLFAISTSGISTFSGLTPTTYSPQPSSAPNSGQ